MKGTRPLDNDETGCFGLSVRDKEIWKIRLTEDITVTENSITITERRYKDPLLEKIRRHRGEKEHANFGITTTQTRNTSTIEGAPVLVSGEGDIYEQSNINQVRTRNLLSEYCQYGTPCHLSR